LEYPVPSIRDFACPLVKLLRPSTGLFELFWSELLTALLPGPLCAGCDCAPQGCGPTIRAIKLIDDWKSSRAFLSLASRHGPWGKVVRLLPQLFCFFEQTFRGSVPESAARLLFSSPRVAKQRGGDLQMKELLRSSCGALRGCYAGKIIRCNS